MLPVSLLVIGRENQTVIVQYPRVLGTKVIAALIIGITELTTGSFYWTERQPTVILRVLRGTWQESQTVV
jgi:hypothetical protein